MTREEAQNVVDNAKMSEQQKSTIMDQWDARNPNAIFAVAGLAKRQQRNGGV
jgi:hypothetical protein